MRRSRSLFLARPFVLALIASAASLACSGKTSAPLPTVDETAGDPADARFSRLLSDLQTYMSDRGVPGASIAIVENGKLAFSAGVGVKKIGASDHVSATTLFRVGSLSKMVLAATTMKLVEEGKLDLNASIESYVPYELATSADPSTISLESLLTHTSGVPDLDVDSTTCAVGAGQEASWFGANGPDAPLAPAGAVWNYSNRGYALMGWAIEQVTGAPYDAAATSLVLGPSGMSTATFDPAVARAGDHAVGHVVKNGATTTYEPDAYDCAVIRPPAGVIASAIDYAHFVEMLFASGAGTISADSVSRMETGIVDTDAYPNQLEKYGFGLMVDDFYKGQHVVRHSGDVPGFRSDVWMVPSQKFAVIVFFNRKPDKSLEQIPEHALDDFLDLASIPEPAYTTDPSTWNEYVGVYGDSNLGEVDVALQNGALVLKAPQYGVSGAALKQSAGDRFSIEEDGESASITFYPKGDEPAAWFVTRQGVGTKM